MRAGDGLFGMWGPRARMLTTQCFISLQEVEDEVDDEVSSDEEADLGEHGAITFCFSPPGRWAHSPLPPLAQTTSPAASSLAPRRRRARLCRSWG